MAAEKEEDPVLTPQNVVQYQSWIGHLAAHAIVDCGAVTFFVDQEGEVRMEIPDRNLVGPGKVIKRGDQG